MPPRSGDLKEPFNRPEASLKTRVRLGIIWMGAAQVVRRLTGLVVTAVLARLLSPKDIGLMALALVATQLMALVSELGLVGALVQRARVDDEDLNTGFWLTLGSASILAILGVATAGPIAQLFDEPRLASVLRVTVLVLPIAALGQISDVLLQRKLDFRRIASIEWSSAIISGVIAIGLAFAGAGVWALVAQYVMSALVALVLRQVHAPWRPSASFESERSVPLLRFGLSLVALALVNYACINIDSALIGGELGTEALGYYALAFNLALFPALNVSGLVTRVMFPALSSLQHDPARFRGAYLRMLRAVAVVTFPLTIGLGVTAHIALPLVYGDKWMPAVALLQILTLVGLLQAVNVSGVVYEAIGKPYILVAYAAVSFCVMTAGFYIGAQWGLRGVAWSYCIVSPLVFLGPHLIANRMIGLHQRDFLGVLAVPLLSSLLMGLAVVIASQPLSHWGLSNPASMLVLVLLGAMTYLVSVWALLRLGGFRGNPVQWAFDQAPSAARSGRPGDALPQL